MRAKVAVITGGSKGIGKSLVKRFHSEGFDVFTCARGQEDLSKLKNNLPDKKGLQTFTADLSRKNEADDFADFVLRSFSEIDVLINNAGLFLPGQVHNEEEGVLEKMIETNLYSAYWLTKKLVPGMIKAKKGHIFNICSTASIQAYISGGSYGIAKHALLGFSKVLREEMKEHNVRVTSILPGATYTDSWAEADLPENRFMDTDDVTDMIWTSYNLSGRAVVEEILLRPQLGDI